MTGRYVVRGGEQVFAPPFLQKNTRLRGFALRADNAALQATCDRLLNEPAGGAVKYRAVGDYVLLAHAPIGSTQATEPPDHDKGYTPETDVAFWMLVAAGHEEAGDFVPDRLAWLLPYVWVDVPTTMATGREVYGYPKELGWLSLPSGPADDLVVGVETMVLPTYTPETELVRKPILRIARAEGEEPAEPSPWPHPKGILDALREAADEVSLGFAEHLLGQLVEGVVPMVFLKQFRDVVDPSRACYQAIIESPARVQGIPLGRPLFATYEVTIEDYASHPIARDLGLGTPAGGTLRVVPSVAFEVRFDFLVELGRVIWQASGP